MKEIHVIFFPMQVMPIFLDTVLILNDVKIMLIE